MPLPIWCGRGRGWSIPPRPPKCANLCRNRCAQLVPDRADALAGGAFVRGVAIRTVLDEPFLHFCNKVSQACWQLMFMDADHQLRVECLSVIPPGRAGTASAENIVTVLEPCQRLRSAGHIMPVNDQTLLRWLCYRPDITARRAHPQDRNFIRPCPEAAAHPQHIAGRNCHHMRKHMVAERVGGIATTISRWPKIATRQYRQSNSPNGRKLRLDCSARAAAKT